MMRWTPAGHHPRRGEGRARPAALCAGLAAILVFAATPPRAAAAATGPVKIGILLPYSGPLTQAGVDATNGIELLLAKVGGKAGGRALTVIKEDTESKPDVGLTKVKKLVERDGVHVLIGPVNSAVALAIRSYVNAQGIPLVIPIANSRAITDPGNSSPWIFRVIETSDQCCYPMGGWMIQHAPYRKVIVMAADFVIGRHSSEAFMAGFKAAGGQVVKEIYAPLNTPDFAPYLAQLTATPADAVWAWFSAADATRFVKQYQEYGLKEKLPLYGYNTLVDDTLLPAIGEAALGVVTAGHYTAVIDTPVNKAFVRDYEQRHKVWPSRFSENGYTAAQLVAAAIEDLKGDVGDRARLRDALRAAAPRIQPPRGPIRFDKYQQVITDIFLTKVERRGNRLVNAIVDRLPAVSQEDTWKWWHK